MLRLLTILTTILLLPALAFGWSGKIVAVEGATSFVILKDGQTPIKVNIAGVKTSPGLEAAKARLETSNLTLMREVEVRELNKTDDGTIVGDITVDGKSLSKELLDEGIVQSTAQTEPAINTTATEIPEELTQPAAPAKQSPILQEDTAPATEANADEIVNELFPETSPQTPAQVSQAPTRKAAVPPQQAQQQQIRYIQYYQPQQQLGLWPERPAPAVPAQPAQVPVQTTQQQTAPKQLLKPGDAAKRDYDLAVSVQRKTRRAKNKGFFVPKKSSETFLGASGGFQASMKDQSEAPFSSFGGLGGISARHFYPSGFGIGGDFIMSSASGASGTRGKTYYDNGTVNSNGTAYDYNNKNFTTYTFTGSLLYRFYTDKNFTPYIAAHAGYSVFDYPNTIFQISDGAPVAGGGAGFLYEFDSGFTIGLDSRYLKTIGGKKEDPSSFFDTLFNIGYTFD